MVAALLALLLLLSWSISFYARRGRLVRPGKPKLPPGPFKLPLVGNLPQLISLTHRSLGELSRRHGPLVHLQVGRSRIVVASSAATAREILKTHDAVFSSRPLLTAGKHLFYGHKDVGLAPYGEHWRRARKICVLHLLSAKRVQSYRWLREEEVARAMENISRKSALGPVILKAVLREFSSDVICRVALGRRYTKRSKVVEEVMALLGEFFVEDVFPWLAWASRASGKHVRLRRCVRELDSFLDEVIEDHASSGHRPAGDLVDVLLALREDDDARSTFLTRDCIKAVILDMFVGGTDTTACAMEWAMSELIRNHRVLGKARDEVRAVAGSKPLVTEADLGQMDYLKAVIKETLRLHPPGPLLAPHESMGGAEISGFSIPAGTRVMVNVWAIGRDPENWEAPEEFMPERFLNGSVHYEGNDFHYLPFGSGRRMCPGMAFASSNMELILANLLHVFDWKLPEGTSLEDIDMAESRGIAVYKKSSLQLLAVARDNHGCMSDPGA